eukprot:153627-Chlamydomonas_euryale.AAC.2
MSGQPGIAALRVAPSRPPPDRRLRYAGLDLPVFLRPPGLSLPPKAAASMQCGQMRCECGRRGRCGQCCGRDCCCARQREVREGVVYMRTVWEGSRCVDGVGRQPLCGQCGKAAAVWTVWEGSRCVDGVGRQPLCGRAGSESQLQALSSASLKGTLLTD